MVTGREAQCARAWTATYRERTELETKVRHFESIESCIHHIRRGEHPFRHDYWTESHHNGDPYKTSDVVWATVKPVATEKDEQYTLVEMPEYEEAMRRIEAASAEPLKEETGLDPW